MSSYVCYCLQQVVSTFDYCNINTSVKCVEYKVTWRKAKNKGCNPLLMMYFTKNHNIWDCGEAGGRLLLAKIVGCYIPCLINLYGYIGNIYCRNYFSVTLVLVWVRKKYCYFHEIQFPKWWWCQTRCHNFLNQWLPPVKPSWECCPNMGLPGYIGWNDW